MNELKLVGVYNCSSDWIPCLAVCFLLTVPWALCYSFESYSILQLSRKIQWLWILTWVEQVLLHVYNELLAAWWDNKLITHFSLFLYFEFYLRSSLSNTLWNLKDINCLYQKECYLCFQKQNINQIWEIICFETILIIHAIICLLLLIFQTERAISKTPQCWRALSHCC